MNPALPLCLFLGIGVSAAAIVHFKRKAFASSVADSDTDATASRQPIASGTACRSLSPETARKLLELGYSDAIL